MIRLNIDSVQLSLLLFMFMSVHFEFYFAGLACYRRLFLLFVVFVDLFKFWLWSREEITCFPSVIRGFSVNVKSLFEILFDCGGHSRAKLFNLGHVFSFLDFGGVELSQDGCTSEGISTRINYLWDILIMIVEKYK